MFNPVSTYRIQFHKGFNFSDFEKVIPYLHELGVKTIYASPIFSAMPGSKHGYDGINPNEIDPEIGSLEQFKQLSEKLKKLGMGWIQDFVPNHMAYSPENPWIFDLLEKGGFSAYNSYFDKELPILLPILGKSLEKAVEEKELSLSFKQGKLWLNYFENRFPLNFHAYREVFSKLKEGEMPSGLAGILNDVTAGETRIQFENAWESLLKFTAEFENDQNRIRALEEKIRKINGDPESLLALIHSQFYRPCYWKKTNEEINYRRFFTVNSLICLNMQDSQVFDEYHKLLADLVREDYIQGVRIDHIDGLADPEEYLIRLRKLLGEETYIIVEKILAEGENLPESWPIEGNTGYDFMAVANKVLINPDAEAAFTDFYQSISSDKTPVKQQLLDAKAQVLFENMQGELNNLSTSFLQLPDLELPAGIGFDKIKQFIAALLLHCPVYRYYPKSLPLENENLRDFEAFLDLLPAEDASQKQVKQFFLAQFTSNNYSKESTKARLRFLRRCMQFTGPLMAKGMEDTLMYRYNRFIVHNEVGGDFEGFAITDHDFHKRMQARQKRSPLSLNTTATHDTKRGEDLRARLQALTFEAEQWQRLMKKWLDKIPSEKGQPSLNDRYFLLQTVLGSLPFQGQENYLERLNAYIVKASREAKKHSNWAEPNEEYEQSLIDYARKIYDPKATVGQEMRGFIANQKEKIILNSLVQLALKFLSPGIPDVYQGTEFWDLSFVDPDNRRPVDYEQLEKTLKEIKALASPKSLLQESDGTKIRLWLLHQLLELRKRKSVLFEKGSFDAVHFDSGSDFISFRRSFGSDEALVILPKGGKAEVPEELRLSLPKGKWRNVLTGKDLESEFSPKEQLDDFPLLVLEATKKPNQRSAGVLLPLFSLDSDFGIGSLGKEAFRFVQFLKDSGQKSWQVLPLNPIIKANSFSPYAAISSFACEPLYIDLELLAEQGWLDAKEVAAAQIENNGKVDYSRALEIKEPLFRKAWQSFQQEKGKKRLAFESFCRQQRWLHDYCLFLAAKKEFNDLPWPDWPKEIRNRDKAALAGFAARQETEMDYQKWLQFIFAEQWNSLKQYCEQRDIRLIGDLPFYVNADSADVWAKPDLVHLNKEGKSSKMAGVPPDYFNADGQLWGMPTYRWLEMEKDGFSWWVERLKRNIDMYHLLRLDHFRAFYDYWEIPEAAKTAKEGKWESGPQGKLFSKILDAFPQMPFIAEDLGDIHQGVYDFRKEWKLPGMRVLQFGFDGYDALSRDLPHNFVGNCLAYTGTHDNNTTLGWFQELDAQSKKAFAAYVGHPVNDSNCAWELIRLAYQSVADLVIIPYMDLLGLDGSARINTPATIEGNWLWRMGGEEQFEELKSRLKELVGRYNR